MTVYLIALIILLILLIVLWRRNDMVRKECFKTLDLIDKLYEKEISEGEKFDRWRYDLYGTIDYFKVWIMFWKPVESFFDKDWENKPE